MKGLFPSILPLAFFATCIALSSCTSIEQPATVKSSFASTRSSSNYASKNRKSWTSKKKRNVRTTAYSHEENEPGAYGRLNAIGTTLKYGKVRSAAADWSRYPLGTRFRIRGEPYIYEIDDFGSALVGTDTIDLYRPNLKLMYAWGVRHVDIDIIKWGSFENSARILSQRTRYWHCRKMYNDIKPNMRKVSTNPVFQFFSARN